MDILVEAYAVTMFFSVVSAIVMILVGYLLLRFLVRNGSHKNFDTVLITGFLIVMSLAVMAFALYGGYLYIERVMG